MFLGDPWCPEFLTPWCLAGVLFNPRHHRLMEYLNELTEVLEPSFSQIVWLLLCNRCYIAFVTIQWLGGIHGTFHGTWQSFMSQEWNKRTFVSDCDDHWCSHVYRCLFHYSLKWGSDKCHRSHVHMSRHFINIIRWHTSNHLQICHRNMWQIFHPTCSTHPKSLFISFLLSKWTTIILRCLVSSWLCNLHWSTLSNLFWNCKRPLRSSKWFNNFLTWSLRLWAIQGSWSTSELFVITWHTPLLCIRPCWNWPWNCYMRVCDITTNVIGTSHQFAVIAVDHRHFGPFVLDVLFQLQIFTVPLGLPKASAQKGSDSAFQRQLFKGLKV